MSVRVPSRGQNLTTLHTQRRIRYMGLWPCVVGDSDCFSHPPCQERENWFQHGLVGVHLSPRRIFDRNDATRHRVGFRGIPNLGHDFLLVCRCFMAVYCVHDLYQSVQWRDVSEIVLSSRTSQLMICLVGLSPLVLEKMKATFWNASTPSLLRIWNGRLIDRQARFFSLAYPKPHYYIFVHDYGFILVTRQRL